LDFRPLLDVLPVAAYLCDPEGLITHFNSRAVQLWGREPKLLDPADRFCGSFRLFSPDGAAIAHEECWSALALRDGCEYAEREVIVEQPSGERRVAVASATAFWDESGRLGGAITTLVDVTDLKTAEQARHETEERFSSFMRHLPAAAWVKDPAGRYTYANDYAQEIFATPLDELKGQTDLGVFPPETAAMFRENDEQVLESGKAVRRIELLEHDGDGIHESIVTKFPILNGSGAIAAIGGVAIDVTEQRRANEALRESEARYRRLAELLPVGVYTCSAPEGTITYFNKEAARIWGRTPAEGDTDERFCGSYRLFRPNGEFLPREDCPMAVSLRDGIEFRNEEAIVERPDGSRITARVNIDPIRDADGRIVGAVNVFHDTTALRDAQRKVVEEKDNLQTLLETLPVAVMIAQDRECRRISGNPAAEQLLRMRPGGNVSKTAPPGEQPEHFRILQQGRVIPSEELPVQRAARGEAIRGEEIDLEFDDGSLVHAAVSARPLLDSMGNSRGAVAALLDITDLKNAENALKEADRRKDEFLATLGHELRNPLAPIRMGLEIMRLAGDDREKLQRTRDMMLRQTEQLITLVDELLDVSRITRGKIELQKRPVKLADVVQHAVEASRPWVEEAGHEIAVDALDAGTWVNGDPNRLTQILCNLLNNACKYTPRGGRIWLTARREGGEAVISVKDNGVGLPREMTGRIFEMFEQLETPQGVQKSGLGIGLTLVKQLVEMHGGQVEAHSAGVGRGTEMIVRVPVLAEASGEENAGEPASKDDPAPRRVLIVDDNRAAADSLSVVVDQLGHEVRTAYGGAEAVAMAATFRPHVMMMDLGMPNMDGYEAARRIRAQPWGEQLLLVAVSGWGQEQHKSRATEAGFDHHVVKPIEAGDIQTILARSGL
jgi:PAS domain S-box-containing protein